MRYLLVPLALTALLAAGCGSDDGSPDAGSPSSGEPSTHGPVETGKVVILHGTAAGAGKESDAAVALPGGADRLLDGIKNPLARKVRAKLTHWNAAEGSRLYGAVFVGCDVPSDVTVQRMGDHFEVQPKYAGATHEECFAPVTSVALVSVKG